MTKEEIISNLLYMKHSVKEDTIEDITINEAIKVLQQEPCTDAISRQAVLEKIHEAPYINDCSNIGMLLEAWINSIPSVKPQYTDAEIQKMQDLEFAEIQKAYEIGKEEGSSEKPNKWIPVESALPEKNMACLVTVGKFKLTQMAMYSDLMGTIDHRIFYQGDYGYDSFEDITEYVKAWMPLPDPYKTSPTGEEDK